MKDMETTKICSKCGRELPLSEFNKDRTRKDGLQTYCKDCRKQYMKQYNKEYYVEHRDERIEYIKQWKVDNLEYDKQYKKQWYADNPEYNKQYMKQWRSTIEGYANMIRYNNLQADRNQGRIRANEDPLPSLEEYIELLQQRDYYDGEQYHWSEMGLDRIDNSKPHTLDNVVPCSTAHNVQRGTMPFEEFKAIFIKNGNT
jgi:hypothetical protein